MRNGIWVRTLNVLNLKYERLVHNSAKVVPLQVFGKFRLLLPYIEGPPPTPNFSRARPRRFSVGCGVFNSETCFAYQPPRCLSVAAPAFSPMELHPGVLPSLQPPSEPQPTAWFQPNYPAETKQMGQVDYYLERQLPNGGLEGCNDPCHYCKLPNALVWGGNCFVPRLPLSHADSPSLSHLFSTVSFAVPSNELEEYLYILAYMPSIAMCCYLWC